MGEWFDEVARVQGEDGTWFRVVLKDEDEPQFCNPREHDGLLLRLVLGHRRYNLPQEDDEVAAAMEEHSLRVVERWLRVCRGATVVLPVYGYDHGNLHVSFGEPGTTGNPYACQWDSGLLGLAFDTPETRAERGLLTDAVADGLLTVVQAAKAEADEFADWFNGEVYGHVIERGTVQLDLPRYRVWDGTDADPDDVEWEDVDADGALWGLIGRTWAEQSAREALTEWVEDYNSDVTAVTSAEPEYAGVVAGTTSREA